MKPLLSFLLIVFITINTIAQSKNSIIETDNLLHLSAQLSTLELAEHTENAPVNTIYKPSLITTEAFTSEILKKRLEQLDSKTPFNVVYNTTVERFIRLYLKTRKDDISNLMDRANYYFPMFEEHLAKYNLPLEIKYLAIVESALKPNARSGAGAKGLWQFMYHTGKQYNLNVTSYIDERADPVKATQAACEYLQSLYTTFGDWDLALAAYNSGPGNVRKAIRRSGGLRNYWNIRKYLPSETSSYVPAFYTTFYLFEYGSAHQIYPKNMNITFYDVDTVLVKKKITFKEIKQRTAIDDELLKFLNPQYRLGIIPVENGKKYSLTLPKTYLKKFISSDKNTAQVIETDTKIEKPNYITPTQNNSYVVKKVDNLSRIARKFNISVTELKKINGLQTNYLIEGQRIVITKNKIGKTQQTSIKSATDKSITFKTYLVKEGDSLWLISRRFPDVTINQLRNWNNIWGVNYLEPGSTLKILTQ